MQQLPEQLIVKQGRGFSREVESCLNVDRPRVVLDCSKVKQLDSAGVRVLLTCLEAAMMRNGDVKLAVIPPGAAAILELARVDHIFEVFASTADAVDSFYQFPTKSFQTLRHGPSTLSYRARRDHFEDGHFDLRERPVAPQITMRASGRWLMRQIAGCLLLLFTAPVANAVLSPPQEANLSQDRGVSSAQPQSQQPNSIAKQVNTEPSPSEALPDSPSAVRSKDRGSSEQQPSSNLQDSTQDPLGTAAAPPAKTTGVAASKPAGAAIAPAKQKRTRSILIKVGVIVGVGAAVGTVVALTSASPSRPH